MPLKIMYGATAANGTGAQRTLFLTYDTNFPGKVATTRRQSELDGDVCTSTGGGSCATTTNTYTADGKLETVTETGLTKTVASYPGSTDYTYTTSYDYDANGRLIEIDGPLVGSTDLTTFGFWSAPSDPLKDGFLQNFKRQKDASNILTQSSLTFDFWGNATSISDVDGTISCQTFSAARGFLTQRREQMAGQTDCTPNSADLVTAYARDTALRLIQLTRPDGSCLIYEYDNRGRLSKTKRRDDCNPASSGDRQEYTYSDDGLLVKIETFDAGNTVTMRQEMTYRDSRRLEKMINPVNTAKWTGIAYTPRGLVSTVTALDGATELSKTSWAYDEEGRVASETRYASTSVFDTWNLVFDWIGGQESVTDDDGKTTSSTRDDLGRVIVLGSPDLGGYPTLRVYDQANRLVTRRESVGGASMKEHLFTFDNLGRPLEADYSGSCQDAFGFLYPVPDIVRAYDTIPGGVTCPFGTGACDQAGRLVYVKVKLMCLPQVIGGGGPDGDFTLEQETFYQYDAAGRVIREFIQDDVAAAPNNRTADHQYTWTKNGALAQTTLPSGAVLGSTFGSAGSNSDTDRVAALWRTTTATPIIDNILYEPYGPFRQYNQMNSVSGSALRTKVLHNLAYRVTETRVESQATSATQHSVAITEDYKGRVTGRDYTPNISGLVDSYFVYDGQDRVLCERPTPGTTCPTSYGGEKNNHYSSAGATNFTPAGDWKSLWRPIVGSTGWAHSFSLVSGTHQIYEVNQNNGTPTYGITRFTYDSRGNRSSDDSITTGSNDQRTYTYDSRRNVIAVQGKYFTYQGPNCGSHGQPLCWAISDYTVTSAFDAQNRRVFKSYKAGANTATWFFYYDVVSRLSEIRYTPNAASPSNYTVYELMWLGEELVAYWQTDYPGVTTFKSYVGRDESGRPIDMMTWPASGDATRAWAINPDAWGNDTVLVPSFQPIVFAGQYQDQETAAYSGSATSSPTRRRPASILNGFRTYDPWVGAYLQVDPLVDSTWSSYGYVNSDPVGKSDPDGLMIGWDSKHEQQIGDTSWGDCWDFGSGVEVSLCIGGLGQREGWAWGAWPFGGGGGNNTPTCPSGKDGSACQSHSCTASCCDNPWFDCGQCNACKSDCERIAERNCAKWGTRLDRDCCRLGVLNKCLSKANAASGKSCHDRCDCFGTGSNGAFPKCSRKCTPTHISEWQCCDGFNEDGSEVGGYVFP